VARVLITNHHCVFGGGAEKHFLDLAEHLESRHNVQFLIAGGYVDPRMRAAGPVRFLPGRGRHALLLLDLLYLAWFVRRERIDLIHAHHRYPAFLAALVRKITDVRVLTTAHNVFPDKAAISLWGDRVIAVSKAVADWLIGTCGVPAGDVALIHNGIGPPTVCGNDDLRAVREEIGLAGEQMFLLTVGRLTEQKNYPLLLEALSRIRNEDWLCAVVGDGEDRDALIRRAAELGLGERVHFLGKRNDVTRLMQAADMLVMSSAWEGFPYVVVEALACGLPIVATDVGGVREGVMHGKTGYLVTPGDSANLADRIRMLLADADQRRTFAVNGRELFEEQFRIEDMYDRTLKEYDRLLASGRR
jgi:glycosyltransferase involved in cell wall biosynthesis